MEPTSATAILNIDLSVQGNNAPEWIELLPVGPNIKARDGRAWHYAPQKVIAAFAANKGPMPVDYEHGQDHLAVKGLPAPAAGWIEELQERNGALWGRVEWTDTGAEQITSKAYRFISPAIRHTKSGEILGLLGAGLVNRPALVMTALSREQFTNNEVEKMTLKAIVKALGLAETADEKAVLAAINVQHTEHVALCQALDLDVASELKAVTEAVVALGEKSKTALAALETAGDLTEIATLRDQVEQGSKDLLALRQKDKTRDIGLALDTAMAEGKITPASRSEYEAMCAVDGGIERFVALAATLPVILKPSKLNSDTIIQTDDVPVDAVALAGLGRIYMDEQHATGRVISISQAIAEVQEKKQ